jgi:hypothetical protein
VGKEKKMNKTNVKADKYYIIDDLWADARDAFVSRNCEDYNDTYGGYYGLDVVFDTFEEAQEFCDKYNAYEDVEGRELNCCARGCYVSAFEYAHWNGKCAYMGTGFEEEEEEEYAEREPRIKRKRYLREKKKLKRILKASKLLKENKAYKREWLLKYQTAIYDNGFHPAWGEPLEITHGYHGFKKTEKVVPLFLETEGEDIKTLPFKEHKIVKNLMPLIISNTWFAVSNTAPLEGEDI